MVIYTHAIPTEVYLAMVRTPWSLVRRVCVCFMVVSGRNDLSLTNLQDVMEDDLFGSPSSGNAGASLNPMGNSSLNSMGNSSLNSMGHTSLNAMSNTSLNPMSNASLNPSSSLSSKPVLGGNSSLFPSNDQLNTFGSMNSLVRKDLSPTLGTLPRLNPSNNSFMLGSFDTDDYGHCASSPLFSLQTLPR